jgi:hypothetical protein
LPIQFFHDQEVTTGGLPLTTSTGSPRPLSFGTATFNLNTAQTELSFIATIFNIDITGTQTADTFDDLVAAHIHVGAPPGANAPVRWGFFGSPDNDINPENLVVTPSRPALEAPSAASEIYQRATTGQRSPPICRTFSRTTLTFSTRSNSAAVKSAAKSKACPMWHQLPRCSRSLWSH